MSDELRTVLPLKLAYAFGKENGIEKEMNDIKEMEINWDSSYTSTVRRGYVVSLFQKKNLYDAFVSKHWPFGLTPSGKTYEARYLRLKQQYEAFLSGSVTAAVDDEPASFEEAEIAFELESQLRDFIAGNLQSIAVRGKKLSLYVDPKGRKGIEYPTEVGPIDILALDQTGTFVVFELKRANSPDRAVGQVARYMGWIKKNLASGKEVHGVIVAKSISDKLRYAITVVPNVSLYVYEVKFHLSPAHEFTSSG